MDRNGFHIHFIRQRNICYGDGDAVVHRMNFCLLSHKAVVYKEYSAREENYGTTPDYSD